jgi:hypothetical protein
MKLHKTMRDQEIGYQSDDQDPAFHRFALGGFGRQGKDSGVQTTRESGKGAFCQRLPWQMVAGANPLEWPLRASNKINMLRGWFEAGRTKIPARRTYRHLSGFDLVRIVFAYANCGWNLSTELYRRRLLR